MELESVFVTGANRGIGLEFVKQIVKFSKPPSFIFATYRKESTIQALKDIQDARKEIHVVLIKMDITKEEEIENARKVLESTLGDRGLNLLINNAGALERQGILDITGENMVFHFTTNVVGPVMVLKKMLPLLQRAATRKAGGMGVSRAAVLNISSKGGSIGETTHELQESWLEMIIGYKISKAALNMAMRVAALTLKDQGILIVNMSPGWVRTAMGSPEGLLNPEESISAMLQTLSQLNESHHGTFLDHNGKTIPF